MKNRRAFFYINFFGLAFIAGLLACTFIVSMFVMDTRHGGIYFWSVIRFTASCILIAIAVEDGLTKEIHDVLLLGLALAGVGALLLSVIGYDACELACFSSGSNLGPGAKLLQFGFSEPGWSLVGAAGRIVGALCISLPMLAITLIWSGSFGSGDVLMAYSRSDLNPLQCCNCNGFSWRAFCRPAAFRHTK